MKIAVCVSGQARTWEYCKENIKKVFTDTDDYQFDFFIHTWDRNDFNFINDDFRIHPIQKKDNDIQNYIDWYKPKMYKIESTQEFNERLDKKWKLKEGIYEPPNTLSLMYSFKKSIQLKKIWERKTGTTYDFVIKIRPDINFVGVDFYEQFQIMRESLNSYPKAKDFISYQHFNPDWKDDMNHLENNTFGSDLYWFFKNDDAEEYATFFERKLNYDRIHKDKTYKQYYHTYLLGFNPISLEIPEPWVVIIRLNHVLFNSFLGDTDSPEYIQNFTILSSFFNKYVGLYHHDIPQEDFEIAGVKTFTELLKENPQLEMMCRTQKYEDVVEKNPYISHHIRKYFKFIRKYL